LAAFSLSIGGVDFDAAHHKERPPMSAEILLTVEEAATSDKRVLASVRQVSFLRGDGGRGGGGADIASLQNVPERAPDFVVSLTTQAEQALVYRLSGDYNPLYADPEAARAAGFAGSIWHGLCTYGFAGRDFLAAACGNDRLAA
jgi:hypothetical protein